MVGFKAARRRFSRFFFRFRDGESAADVYDRVTTFRETLRNDINFGRSVPGMPSSLCSAALYCRVSGFPAQSDVCIFPLFTSSASPPLSASCLCPCCLWGILTLLAFLPGQPLLAAAGLEPKAARKQQQ